MIKRKVQYQGLDKLPVLIEDTSTDSPFYFRLKDIPSELAGGKNLIKIRLSDNLKIGSDIQFEILDYNGDPIYSEFTNYLAEDGESRVISIWIYSDAPPGNATMYLVGTATRTPENSPIIHQQTTSPNLRWLKKIQIVPDKRNSTPILFEIPPSASISEIVSPYLRRTYAGGSKDQIYTTGQISYQLIGDKATAQLQNGTLPTDATGGTLTVTSPVNPIPTATGTPSSIIYKTSIKKILDEYNALLGSPYEVRIDNSNIPARYRYFEPSSFQIDYEQTPTYVATENSMSYAFVRLNAVSPTTGDVYRIKTSRRGPGMIADWEQVDDSLLEASEILEATGSLYTKTKIGQITSTSVITDYWNIDNSYNSISPTPTIERKRTPLNDSIRVNTQGNEIPSGQSIRVETKNKFEFQKGGNYVFQFDTFSERTGSASTINVYLSGSSFNWKGINTVKGKKLFTLNPPGETHRNMDYKVDFEADDSGEGKLIFEIEKGTWYLGDISIKSSQDIGFTPNNFTVTIPIETKMLNDEVDFKFEYFDYLGNQAKHITYVLDKTFGGGNTYIDGANNLLTGSMYIGRRFGSGLEQSGKNSGIIKSSGYLGFIEASASRDDPNSGPAGFMIWSGSAEPGGTLTTYQGVGIEAIANSESYLRYTTDPSQLDIRTDTFFLGSSKSQFLSGSGGILEISSSNFHLDHTGVKVTTGSHEMINTHTAFVFAYNIARQIYFDFSQSVVTHTAGTYANDTNFTASQFSFVPHRGEDVLEVAGQASSANVETGYKSLYDAFQVWIASGSAKEYNVFSEYSQSFKLYGGTSQYPGKWTPNRAGTFTMNFEIPSKYSGSLCRGMVVRHVSSSATSGDYHQGNFVIGVTSKGLGEQGGTLTDQHSTPSS